MLSFTYGILDDANDNDNANANAYANEYNAYANADNSLMRVTQNNKTRTTSFPLLAATVVYIPHLLLSN